MKSIFAHISGLDHKRTGCSFLALTLGTISVSGYNLNLSLVVCASSETLNVARQKQVLSLIFLQLKGSGIFKPVEIQKKKKKKPTMKPVHKLIIMQISNRYPFSHYLRCFLPSVGNKPASGRLPEEP